MWTVLTLSVALGVAQAQDDVAGYDHLVVLLDGSGSMEEVFGEGTRMDAARDALTMVLGELSPDTRVGVLCFSGLVDDPWLVDLQPKVDDMLMRGAVRRAIPSGKTPLGAYIKRGADRLLQARNEQHGYGTYRLLVVTDGEASDPGRVDSFAPELVSRGISLDVIGVAMSQEHTLKRYAHTYRSADDPTKLVQTIREAVAEVAAGDDGQVTFEALDGLPHEFAMAALASLTEVSGWNQPLGELPPPPPSAAPPAAPATAPADDVEPVSLSDGDAGGCSTLPASGLAASFGLLLSGLLMRRRNR